MANLARAPGALASFASNCGKFRALNGVYNAHLEKTGPATQTEQVFSKYHQLYVADESKRIVVSDSLPMSRKEFTELLTYKEDIDRMTQPLLMTFAFGGLSLVGLPVWANATHKLPSTFFNTEEEKIAAGKARDQEVHIKHAPICAYTQGRLLEYFISQDPKFNEAFDCITNGFTSPKDPAAIRKMGQHITKAGTCSLPLLTADVSSFLRGREHYEACAFLGKPFTFISNEALTSRLIDHYKGLFQEDFLIQKEGVNTLSDFELYQVCNRRLIARWEEELNRAQLESRLNDWMTLTQVKAGEDLVPIRVLLCYQASFFRDPGFLDATLESLDTDAFPSSWNWAKDAFARRVEFESGPLANQVRAHLLNLEASEAKRAEERKTYLESKQ